MSIHDRLDPRPTREELDAVIWSILRGRNAAYRYDPAHDFEPDDTELSPAESDQAADRAEARETKQREWRASE